MYLHKNQNSFSMKKNPLFVAFSTQKGGIGKTTLTVLFSSYLHYVKGYNVAVIDSDFPQHSVVKMRAREIDQVMNDPYYNKMAEEQFTRLDKPAFAIVEAKAEEAIAVAEELINRTSDEFDFILFDLPGTLNGEGIVNTLASVDYIFAPISADRMVLESTLQFAILINDIIIKPKAGNVKGMYLIWNLVDGREKTKLYLAYENAIKDLELHVLNNVLPDSKRFRHEMEEEHKPVFRSTLFPIDKRLLSGSNFDLLSEEIIQLINQNKHE